eukprot:75516-Alexandrium_andersonii.AAC.1
MGRLEADESQAVLRDPLETRGTLCHVPAGHAELPGRGNTPDASVKAAGAPRQLEKPPERL